MSDQPSPTFAALRAETLFSVAGKVVAITGANGKTLSQVERRSESYAGADVDGMALTLVNEQAEEVVSETMVRAMGTIERYQPGPVGIEAWLFGIARNVVFEAYRAGSRVRATDPAGSQLSGRFPVTVDAPRSTVGGARPG